jgi:hypothetical protein
MAKSFRRVVFRIRKHFWLLSTGKWYFSIAFFANSVVNGIFNTHIHQRKSRTMQEVLQGFGTIYIEGHRRVLEITNDILNNMSNNNCKYGRYCLVVVFALTLTFTWFSLLIIHVFVAVFRLFHSKQGFVTLFLNRFCGYSCFDL